MHVWHTQTHMYTVERAQGRNQDSNGKNDGYIIAMQLAKAAPPPPSNPRAVG